MNYATQQRMKLPIMGIVAILAALWIPSFPLWGQSSDDEARDLIQRQLNEQVNAWNEGNLERFMETYWKSPDLTFSSGGETTRGWQATLDRYRTRYGSREKMGRLRFDGIEFHRCSDNVVLVLGNWYLERIDDAPRGNFSLVWKVIDGQWRIIHDHSSTMEKSSNDDGDDQAKSGSLETSSSRAG